MAGPLSAARVQDAAAWVTIAVALVLAPWARFWRTLALAQPEPAAAFVAGGVALAAVAAAHGAGLLGDGRRPVVAALLADLAAACALTAWLLAADPATGTLGTVVLAVTAASLALQALFDAAMLRRPAA